MIHFVLLVGCAVAIYLSCEWFVNAVEWLGRRLDVGQMAVGTVLAAIGTALPESVVTFVAVVFGQGSAGADIGVGAAMGGPLALATVAYGVVGVTLLIRARVARRPVAAGSGGGGSGGVGGTPPTGHAPVEVDDRAKLARDQTWFLLVFLVKVGLGLVAFAIKPWLGIVFFLGYGLYVWREVRAEGAAVEGDLAPLRLQRSRARPDTWAVVVQTLASLTVIFVASQLFVRQLDAVGPLLGLAPAVTALLLSPIATELPEILNAVIWVRQGKTTLALANISGSMMIQATVPSGIAILLTPWRLDTPLLLAGAATIVAIAFLLLRLRRRRLTARTLAAVGLVYLAFAGALVAVLA